MTLQLLLGLAGAALLAGVTALVDARSPGSRRAVWRTLSYGAFFLALLAQPAFERLRLPDPHNLPERKREILAAAAAAALLLAAACEHALALRRRVESGGRVGAWPVLLPLLWLSAASVWTTRWNMTGDAPHYLLIAHSLVQDGDLDLADDFAAGEAAAFYPRMPLEPQDRVVDGRMVSWHKPGLAALLAPAYAAGGPALAVGTLCLVAGLLGGALWALLAAAGMDARRAWWAWAACVLAPPFFSQGAMVLTEVPAALCVALALWGLLRLGRPGAAAAVGWAAFCLPWLNSRYFAFYPVLAAALWWRGRGRGASTLAAWAGLAAGVLSSAAYTYVYFGDASPTGGMTQASLNPADIPHFSLAWARQSVLGQFWDQEFGLGLTAPLWLPALAGLGLAARRGRWTGWAALGLFAVNYGMLSFWFAWQGQMTPNRFYTPLLPVLALGLAWAAPGDGPGLRRAWLAAGGVSLALSWAYTALPWLAFNRGDGANWLLKLPQGFLGLRLSAWLPSFQRPGPLDWAWGLVLSALLAWALWRLVRGATGLTPRRPSLKVAAGFRKALKG